jgi:hypothetical protein
MEHVDLVQRVPMLVVALEDRLGPDVVPDVVDQHVDRSSEAGCGRYGRRDLMRVTNVCRHCSGAAARALDRLHALGREVGLDVDDHDVRACRGKCIRRRTADAGPATGDQRDAPRKVDLCGHRKAVARARKKASADSGSSANAVNVR